MKNVSQDSGRQWYRGEFSESLEFSKSLESLESKSKSDSRQEPGDVCHDHGGEVSELFLPTQDLLDARLAGEQKPSVTPRGCARQFRRHESLSDAAEGTTSTSLDMLK